MDGVPAKGEEAVRSHGWRKVGAKISGIRNSRFIFGIGNRVESSRNDEAGRGVTLYIGKLGSGKTNGLWEGLTEI